METFTTKIQSSSVDIFEDQSAELRPSGFTVIWGAEVEARTYGIKGISSAVFSVKGSLSVIENDEVVGELEINTEDNPSSFAVISEISVDKYGGVCPAEIEINLIKKIIEVR